MTGSFLVKYKISLLNSRKRKADINEFFDISETSVPSRFDLQLIFRDNTNIHSLYIDFYFKNIISAWRTTAYQWAIYPKEKQISNYYTPKILKLSDGSLITGRNTAGAWLYDPSEKKRLRWIFYHPDLTPTVFMDTDHIRKSLDTQEIFKGQVVDCGLLLGKGTIEEFSRTPIGFVSILCFTDHADFDNLQALRAQRRIFHETGIRVTKSFFLYNLDSGASSASFENENDEYLQWEKEGHELCFHALSNICMDDWKDKFNSLKTPNGLRPINCYIDHSSHPYNYTKASEPGKWCEIVWSKGVNLIWNYIDSCDGNIFSINQLDPNGFSARKIIESARIMKKDGCSRPLIEIIRNLLMYFVDERLTSLSIRLKVYLRKFLAGKKIHYLFSTLAMFFNVLFHYFLNPLFYFKLFYKYSKPFNHAQLAPIIFKGINQLNSNVRVMQTIAVRDFDITFSDIALKRFIDTNGVCIAHTYFAVLRSYHKGRLFENHDYNLRPHSIKTLNKLSALIKAQKIWNPTVSELSEFFVQLEHLIYKIDKDGNIIIDKSINSNISTRQLKKDSSITNGVR